MSGSFLFQAVIYLTAAIICVPIAKWLGMGSVLGYLLAGILIGPYLLGFIGEEGEDILHFAEFGVVMMLFLIGLELEPSKFLKMWKVIVGMGGMQVGVTAVLVFGGCMFLGLAWQAALAIGLSLSLSSTAIVLQTLKEKNLMGTAAGQGSFSVLLFQDIAVIPILAVLPLLAIQGAEAGGDDHGSHSFIENFPAWVQTFAVLAAVALIIVAGRYIIVPLLRLVAKTRLRELFSGSALLIVFAIAYLMEMVGLSPALGTFLGGVVLANSEFRHELESDLEPFKGLLLGLFFIAVGASINFQLISEQPGTMMAIVGSIVVVKGLVLFAVGRVFKLRIDQNLIFALGLAQVGEFAFVLFSFIGQLGILEGKMIDLFMGVTAISMVVTPLIMLANEKLFLPRIGTKEVEEKPMDTMEEDNAVILVGFGHFGSTIGRFLRANGIEATILDNDSDRVDLLRKMGFEVYYGDATRPDLLESAGADKAKIMVTAIDSPETNMRVVETVQKHFPHLELFVRARSRFDAYELLDEGIEDIYRESLDTSVKMGVDILKRLGHRHYSAFRAAQNFIKYDEASMRKLAADRHDRKQYISRVREEIQIQESQLKVDMRRRNQSGDTDHAWDSEQMREATKNGQPVR
ncbi:MAG: monovalent cation:proton antiporter-2 (CPA2) family protein [Bacteroidota bacterium]